MLANRLLALTEAALEKTRKNGEPDFVLQLQGGHSLYCRVIERSRINLTRELHEARAYAALAGMSPVVIFRHRGTEKWTVAMPAEDFSCVPWKNL